MKNNTAFITGGLSFAKLLKNPNGIEIHKQLPIGNFADELATSDKRVDLAPPEIASELERLSADRYYENAAYPLRLISLREVLSHNTWMHNVDSLMTRKRTHAVRLHPDDAKARGIEEGDDIVVRSSSGEVRSHAKLSDTP